MTAAKSTTGAALLQTIPDMMFRIDSTGVIMEYFGGMQSFTLLPAPSLPGKPLNDAFPADIVSQTLICIQTTLQTGDLQVFESTISHLGKTLQVEVQMVRSGYGEVLAIVRDLSSRKKHEQQLRHLRYYDPLTGLPNRQHFLHRFELCLQLAKHAKQEIALLLLDLDQFKRFNDTLGHPVGDELLCHTAKHLVAFTNKKPHPLTQKQQLVRVEVARLGGDEFAILIRATNAKTAAQQHIEKIQHTFATPITLAKKEFYITPSIGVALFPQDGSSTDTLLKYADTAMYAAKTHGRNSYRFYNSEYSSIYSSHIRLEPKLRKAIENNELLLYFQPKMDIYSGEVIGAEALLRWKNPELGMVSPVEFIPLAEENGMIIEIGEWVLRRACEQVAQWQGTEFELPRLAVNISGQQLRDPNFGNQIAEVFSEYEVDPQRLEFELTESVIMHNLKTANQFFNELKELGIRLAIDDFGTGYSSLSYLKRLPIHSLKIDRSFLINIPEDRDNAAITRAIQALAVNLGLDTVAEGVETTAQAVFLKEIGCSSAQGYLFSKPIPQDEFEQFLLKNKKSIETQKRAAG